MPLQSSVTCDATGCLCSGLPTWSGVVLHDSLTYAMAIPWLIHARFPHKEEEHALIAWQSWLHTLRLAQPVS